jgi:hypothetical protein
MIYEQRVYTAMPGRMADLLKRFEQNTLRIWDRLGIRSEGFFVPVVGSSNHELTYYLVWDTLTQREQVWTAFLNDPEWKEVRAASEANGLLVANVANQLLAPTSFARLATRSA